ncbi:MAG TPA: N-acetylmuramoyl-L-alanine amidase [Anaerolineae bacterium]|nr:N-acetylmuramoyl-L-alanine amidase [Anaerolineae bacterium]HRV94549.1 N-acetylmuramoyl-L-alanine amidase [Anaerolineae bacterium]
MARFDVQVDLDNTTYQIAANRAEGEGKSLGQVVAEFLVQYADGARGGALTSYTVQRGDTLGRIAARFYGDARKYPVIQRANNISNPSRIWIGQVLVIPPLATPSPAPAPTPSPVPTPPPPPTPAPSPSPSPSPLSIPTPPPTPTPSPAPGGKPAKPAIRWVGSPNFNNRRRPDDITAIVIHSTANSTLDGVITWFNNPSAQVSAHYTIGKDGQIVQHVQDIHRAWHAGRSTWKNRENCNDYALGIEMVNLNDGQDPYPEAQHRANVALCAYLVDKYNISVDDIMGHLDIAIPPGRKSDPRAYDLDRLRREVAAVVGPG